MGRFIAGMISGAVLLYVAMSYHVVRGSEGFSLVPKIDKNLTDVYADVREYSIEDWKNHKALAAAILKSDRSELIADPALRSVGESVDSLVDGFFSGR